MSSPEPAHDQVLINGEAHPLPADGALVTLLAELDLVGKRIAVAINRAVVPRSEHATCRVSAGDRIEILEAVGGG